MAVESLLFNTHSSKVLGLWSRPQIFIYRAISLHCIEIFTTTSSIRKKRLSKRLIGERVVVSKMSGYEGTTVTSDVSTGKMVFEPILEEGVFRFDCSADDRNGAFPSLSFANPKDRDTPIMTSQKVPTYSPTFECGGGQQTVTIELPVGTSFYGTGEVSGQLERTGKRVFTWNTDAWGYGSGTTSLYQSHPWVFAVFPNGEALGVLADTTRRCEIDLRKDSTIKFIAQSSYPVITFGPFTSPTDVLTSLSRATGTIFMPSKWSLGYQQCRWSYDSDARVREIAKTFREKGIPCDVIWMDIDYMDGFRCFTFDKERFPDPKSLAKDLHHTGFNAIWMLDPGIKHEEGYFVYDSGSERDIWVLGADGKPFVGDVWPGPCVFPDFTQLNARIWWAGLVKEFISNGVDGIWNDMNEPAVFKVVTKTMPESNIHRGDTELGGCQNHLHYHNVYGMLMARSTYEGMKLANENKRPFVLTRAGFVGSQRYASTWTGDNLSTWEHLHMSISMVLQLGLSGQPLSGPDIGGFAGNATPKLFGRWMGVGAMFPFCRGHSETNTIDHEPWSFGEECEEVCRLALKRRYRLIEGHHSLVDWVALVLTKLSNFMEKRDREFIKQNGSSFYPTPIPSLTSSDSCVSSCSDFSVDASSNGRGYQEEASTDSGQEDINFSLKGQPRDFSLPTHVNGVPQSNIVVKNVNNGFIGGDARIIGNGDDQRIGSGFERDDENDAEFWLPPEPEDYENDFEGSVANYEDDDDDCGDGVKWGKPSSLSSFEEVGSGSYRCKEAKQKAMNEVMNGKFKAYVSQLLKFVGVDFGGKDGDSWVDIVTSLSWDAASFVKPVTVEGKAMDPDGYVKIKCIATGSRNQSQLFKGLVFKKHAAHKHMPTTYKNPRLLLIQGALDLSSSGFSSLLSDDQKKMSLNSIIQMIERCHPNVVLVEKSVSGDIQESIREKGMTLVFDMKLHRLERVARCIGSSILSSDLVNGQRLKQCDSFCFEKFVEEHNTIGEGGKRPSKTLMFLEGCPTRLGCTILLKGTRSDELKKIKCVVQNAVLVAYHLILETSFLLDQRAMFATIPLKGLASILANDPLPPVKSGDPDVHNPEESSDENEVSCAIDVPISNGFHEEGSHEMRLEGNSSLFYEPYNPIVLSLSSSLKKAIGDNFPLLSTSHQSISTYFGFNGTSETPIEISSSPEATDNCDMEIKGSSDEENEFNNEPHSSTAYSKEDRLDTGRHGGSDEDQTHSKDDITTLLDSESILVLLSRRNALKGTICEQSRFSHIKFYRNFDVPLGNFLRDEILSQRLVCNTCGEPPESHIYYYAHHNKQLTIQIRRLPEKKRLAGESKGKLWMWSCCGKCKRHKHGKSKSTRRVLVSDAARDFSFGKFLELSLSNHSSFSVPSSCGHYLHRDFYYFFGLGPMVAMFKYSPVVTYSVSLPPQIVEFENSIRRDLLHEDFANVHAKGDLMFLEIEKSLKAIGSRFEGLTLNLHGSLKEFSDIVKMLKLERHQFQVDFQSIAENWDPDVAVYKHVILNRIRWELLLESCVWDLRVYSLLSSDLTVTDIGRLTEEEADVEDITVEGGNDVFYNGSEITDSSSQEIPIEGFEEQNESNVARINENGSYSHDENPTEDNLRLSSQFGEIVQNAKDLRGIVIDPNPSQSGKSLFSMLSNLENSKGWIWTPFPEIRREFMSDLHRGFSPKFEPINIHARGSRVHDMINEEGSRLHIPLGRDDHIVSDYEDELSSVIACALALLHDIQIVTEDFGEETKVYDNSHALARLSSLAMMPHWSSFGSLDSDGFDSLTSISSEEGSHGLHLFDCLASLRVPHPEVSMGLRKFPGKGKNSVVCLYANKFRELRNRCCSSELAYIASLSRCMNWDAKGGKSKSFFAKTHDERFIIKEIKRIEFDSFMKFASDYFTYMNECHELGNQTCLAKIFGIYQVREMKGGKETRHDLMVMENLTFCRHVTRQYDLKGALHARFNSSAGGSGDDVLLDQNFVNDMNVSPLYVNRSAKRDLQRAVWNDTTFLNSINVMDYSLLVGVDTQKRELVCGIIDYLRQYTWDKQLENWVKSSLVVPRNQLPTVISPKEYKKRFRKFITTHFLSVPDNWCIRSEINNGDSSHHITRSQEEGEKLNSTT